MILKERLKEKSPKFDMKNSRRWIVSFITIYLAIWGLQIRAQSTQIHIQPAAAGALLEWSGGILQSASTVNGPWSAVPDASSPLTLGNLQGAKYFRVQKAYLLTVNKTGTGAGSIRSTTSGIDCGLDCSELVPAGATITLQASPQAGSSFAGWTGDGVGTTDRQIVMDGPKTVSAAFTSEPVGILNGNFEQGPGIGWQQFPSTVIVTGEEAGVTPYSGQYLARLGFHPDNRRLAQIGQNIALPNSTPIYINFAAWIYSEELCDVPYYDSLNIYAAGQQIVHKDLCSNNGSNTGGWVRASIDVSAAAGQTIPVVFEISSADALTSILLLDDIAISNTQW